MEFEIVSRVEWGAGRIFNSSMEQLEGPVSRVVLACTNSEECTTRALCAGIARGVRLRHREDRELEDLGYNFLIGGDGQIYEGRGWKYAPDPLDAPDEPAFKEGGALAVAYIGKFDEDTSPPLLMNERFNELVQFGMENNHIAQDCKIVARPQLEKPLE